MTAVLLSRNSAFAEFKLRGHRGSGGFSDVYEAVGANGKRVAIKVLRTPSSTAVKNIQRFERELRILEKMDNRRIARLVMSKLDADPPWIASEYIDGPNLREAISEKGILSIDDALQLLAVIAKILSDIHLLGVSHRDISPNNILLGEFGPVVIDFGSAKDGLTSEFGSVLSVGTPGFASPEVLGGQNVGSASDVFSLAQVFLFAIGKTDGDAGLNELAGITVPQRKILKSCFSEDPTQRPTSSELASAFPLLEIGPQLTSNGYADVVIRKLPRRIGVFTATVGVLLSVIMAVLITVFFVRSDSKPVTVESIQRIASKSDQKIQFSKALLSSGWLLSAPEFVGYPIRHQRPSLLDQDDSELGIESYISNVIPREGYLETKVEFLRYDLAESLKDLDVTVSGNYSFQKNVLLNDKFDNFVNYFLSKSSTGTCQVLATSEYELTADTVSPRIRLLGMLDDCEYLNRKISGFMLMDIYPIQRAAVLATVYYRDANIDLNTFLDSFTIPKNSLIQTLDVGEVKMFETRSSNPNILDLVNSSKDGGFNIYARRAFMVGPKKSIKIDAPLTDLDGTSTVSMSVFFDVDAGSNSGPVFINLPISYGAVVNLRQSESRIFSNPTDWGMVLIVEVNEVGKKSIDYRIKQFEGSSSWNTMFQISQFAGSGQENLDGYGTMNPPLDMWFGLPSSNSEDDLKRGDFRKIGGIIYPVPYGWNIYSDIVFPSHEESAIHADPYGFPISSILADTPRLEVIDDGVAEVVLRSSGFLWYVNDYENCLQPPMKFEKIVGKTKFSWKVLTNCSLPFEESFGNSNRRKSEQSNPIIKFMISTSIKTTPGANLDFGIVRGEFVPEIDTGIAFWNEFVEVVMAQQKQIQAVGQRKCSSWFDPSYCIVD